MMRKIQLLWMFIGICLSGCHSQSVPKRVVLAYVTSWGTSVPDPLLVTHINYAFAHVNETFDGIRVDNEERLRMVTGLKKQNKSLKVLLSIGGWGSGRFSEMAMKDETRKAFAEDCKRVMDTFNLDGIDMDWEYPTAGGAGISASASDKDNYTLLMKDIRSAIGKDKLLTLASVASGDYIDFVSIEPYVDFVNIMTYDISRPPYHHASLYRSEMTRGLSCEEAVAAHVKAGMPIERLVLGIPFYGHGLDRIPDFINYNVIVKLEGYTCRLDSVARVPYLVNDENEMVCSYEDSASIKAKCDFLNAKGMLGVMYWDYDGDDTRGTLRKAVYNGVIKQ